MHMLMSLEEVTLEYINKLRFENEKLEQDAEDVAQVGPYIQSYDEATRQHHQMEEVRAKNTALEIKHRELAALYDKQKLLHAEIVEGQANTITELRREYETLTKTYQETIYARDTALAEVRAFREQNITLVNANNDLAQRPTSLPGGVDAFSAECGRWVKDTFNDAVLHDVGERARRLHEEATEVMQTLGVSKMVAHKIVDYVYARPQGAINQEMGGVIMTWGALINALGLSATSVMDGAIKDCWARQAEIKIKWRAKITKGISGDASQVQPGIRSFPVPGVGMVTQVDLKAQPYNDAPQTHDQRGADIIAEGRQALDTHNAATRDPHL